VGSPVHPAVGQAKRLLESRLAYRWTLTELAGGLHLAPGYLVRLFRSAAARPPMANLAQLRAEHAATLLLQLHTDELSVVQDGGVVTEVHPRGA